MPLSIQKLENLLAEKALVITKFFLLDGTCFYIQLFSVKTADVFLMYIPSKYTFEIDDRMQGQEVYRIKYLDLANSGELSDDYAGGKTADPEEIYGNVDIILQPGDKGIEEHLESRYRKQITLKDVSVEDLNVLRAVYRQVNRLKFCVQSLKYKLGIFYKNYLCVIRRDDTVDTFMIKNFPRDETKKLMIICDLETVYEKNESVLEDVQVVRDSIYKILEKNQSMYSDVLEKILQNKKDMMIIPLQVERKKAKYTEMLRKLSNQLNTMKEAEEKVLYELASLEENSSENMHSDITRVHQKSKLNRDLEKIMRIKGEIATVMLKVRERRDNKILNIDKISFDNTVMMDAMLKNFANLKDFC
jgi:hypothetical protein